MIDANQNKWISPGEAVVGNYHPGMLPRQRLKRELKTQFEFAMKDERAKKCALPFHSTG
jgi:hypothetical protein